MNTTAKGNKLEDKIFSYLNNELNNDRLCFKKSCCKIFKKKGYYSKDRDSLIIFDISIEISIPGNTDYSMLWIIECKNYNHSVPVDDAEEFFTKLQQVSGANIKGTIASTNSFQRGALKFAKSKGLGLLRFFNKNDVKWILNRSPSAMARSKSDADSIRVDLGLSSEHYNSDIFDLYLQSPIRSTNSLWEFLEDIAFDETLETSDLRNTLNDRNRLVSQVKFIEKDEIEYKCTKIHREIGYSSGEVLLERLCANLQEKNNLKVIKLPLDKNNINSKIILGQIIFNPPEIWLFEQEKNHRGRERFTLGHELGHFLMGHGEHMEKEYCEASDFSTVTPQAIEASDIERMEWQANFFSSCLLMPRENFMRDFRLFIRQRDIPDRGFGTLYVDNQTCNLQNYQMVTGSLMSHYGVSRSSVKIRLEGLGLLKDSRDAIQKKEKTGALFSGISDESD